MQSRIQTAMKKKQLWHGAKLLATQQISFAQAKKAEADRAKAKAAAKAKADAKAKVDPKRKSRITLVPQPKWAAADPAPAPAPAPNPAPAPQGPYQSKFNYQKIQKHAALSADRAKARHLTKMAAKALL